MVRPDRRFLNDSAEPMNRIELLTYGLRNRCSTTELHWQPVQATDVNTPQSFGKVENLAPNAKPGKMLRETDSISNPFQKKSADHHLIGRRSTVS